METVKRNRRAREAAFTASKICAQAAFAAGTRGKRNRLEMDGAFIRGRLHVEVRGDDNLVTIAPGCRLSNANIVIRGNGNRLRLCEGVKFVKSGTLWAEDDGCSITVGPGTTFEDAGLAVMEGTSASIGSNCMLAGGVEIRTGDSHPIFDLDSGERINPARSVSIGDRVWIGKRSTVLKGVRIADGVVIGLGSTVVSSIDEANAVAVGSPAQVVRRAVRWHR